MPISQIVRAFDLVGKFWKFGIRIRRSTTIIRLRVQCKARKYFKLTADALPIYGTTSVLFEGPYIGLVRPVVMRLDSLDANLTINEPTINNCQVVLKL